VDQGHLKVSQVEQHPGRIILQLEQSRGRLMAQVTQLTKVSLFHHLMNKFCMRLDWQQKGKKLRK